MSNLEEQLAGLSVEERARIRWNFRRAAAARTSISEFFEYVIREENTQLPVKVVPHQRLFFKFREAHPRCVIRMPVGFSKTFSTAAYLLHGMGEDPFMRAAVISSTSDQAQKPLAMVRFYIEESAELRIVFPKLRRTQREGEPWTQSRLIIDRPGVMRDATLTAIGQATGRLPGSRLKWIAVDDILSRENSRTKAQRRGVIEWFGGEVMSRLDRLDARCCVTNTPRDPEDLTYFLEEQGWPTMTMDSFGDIRFRNTAFDCDDVRLTYRVRGTSDNVQDEPCRLVANDAPALVAQAMEQVHPGVAPASTDVEEVVPLWPARWDYPALVESRTKAVSLHEWNQTMRCVAISDESSKVKRAWIERAQQLARDLGCERTVGSFSGGNTFTGVDVAIGKGERNDRTCLFTIHIDGLGRRVVLDVDVGRWSGTEILARLKRKHEQYGSIIRFETNAAQMWGKEFALEADPSLPIRSHNTGRNKTDVNFGLEMVFTDIENGLWVIPSGDPGVDRWISEMYEYDPEKHTGNCLMASWLAREQARQSGAIAAARSRRRGPNVGLGNISAR